MPEYTLGGRLEGRTHCVPMRVYYADTDAGGVVYHANFLVFAERARSETMRAMGLDLAGLQRDYGLIFAVRQCLADFHRPARLDDLLEVRTTLRRLGGASAEVVQRILRDDEDLATLYVKLAGVGADGKVARFPAAVRTVLKGFLEEAN
jgi:acyl-CoA thioester hydrolase